MKKLNNTPKRFFAICIGLIILDLIFKNLILSNFEQGSYEKIGGGLMNIGKVKTTQRPFGSGLFNTLFPIAQILFVLLTFRLQKLEIHKLFKYSSAMIVFGWIGNFLDKLILSNWESGYVHLDYFNIGRKGPFMNISSILASIGLILFVVAIIIGFKDLKKIFKKSAA